MSELEAFKIGEYCSGLGANNIQRNKRRATTKIRKYPSSIVKSEDGYEPLKKLSGERSNYLKVDFQKQNKMKRKRQVYNGPLTSNLSQQQQKKWGVVAIYS